MAAPRRKSLNLSEWIGVFERFAPQSVAFDWDSAGLQVGDPGKSIRRVSAALEATPETVAAAVKSRSDLLVIHHPLIWKPLKSMVSSDPIARVAIQCIQNDLAVYAAHTSWDLCPLSMTRHLGRLLNLKHLQPLLPKPQPEGVKLVVFVPETHLAQVRQAMAEAGAGTIGNYTECSFSVEGTGTFFGQEGAAPTLGEAGRLEQVREHRLEMLIPPNRLGAVTSALIRAHPYEEAAYDVYVTPSFRTDRHLLWTGRLPRPLRASTLAERIQEALQCAPVRFTGASNRVVQSLALCSGSGKSLISTVAHLPADAFLTGDLDYHSAREAEALGLTVFDAGHFGTEKFFPHLVREACQGFPEMKKVPVKVLEVQREAFRS